MSIVNCKCKRMNAVQGKFKNRSVCKIRKQCSTHDPEPIRPVRVLHPRPVMLPQHGWNGDIERHCHRHRLLAQVVACARSEGVKRCAHFTEESTSAGRSGVLRSGRSRISLQEPSRVQQEIPGVFRTGCPRNGVDTRPINW